MRTPFEEMMAGLGDVESFLAGKTEGFKVHVPDDVDVRRIRSSLKMTQSRFSNTFGFSLDAIKHWEGGRRKPEAAARTLLTVISRNPEAVISALHPQPMNARVPSARQRQARRASKRAHPDSAKSKSARNARSEK
jgi:putative transcriptional regulator